MRAQCAATADILRIISQSPPDARPVFDVIVAHAARLCDANFAFLMLYENGRLQLVARTACTEEFAGYLGKGLALDRRTTTGRAALERRPVQVVDFLADPEAVVTSAHSAEGVRTVLALPLLRRDALLGVIAIWRHEVRPFSEQQTRLLETFADQAVIAIENVRLFQELELKNRGLTEALEWQSATAEILRVISSSPIGLQSVLDAVVERAARLCGSDDAMIRFADGDGLRRVAHFGSLAEPANTDVHPIHFEGVGSRAFLERRAIHVEDVLEEFRRGNYLDGRTLQEPIGYRTMLAVPLLRKEEAIGVILIRRMIAQPFTDKQIELLQAFADEVVITIENARLFQALETRNRELTEALEQQTATSEVLKVISRSSFELEPVLQTLIEYAARLCEADQGFIFRRGEDGYRLAVAHRAPPAFTQWRLIAPIKFGERGSVVGRAGSEGRIVQIADAQRDSEWQEAHRDAAGIRDVRTMLGVPMLREGVPIGVIAMWRTVVRPFSERQIELTKTFADQAVIAIENVRLFQELELKNRGLTEALERQTATAEILRVISSSPTDVLPVFETIVRNAGILCGSRFANVFRFDGELLHYVASYNTGPGFADLLQSKYPMRPDRSQISGRVILTKSIVSLQDARADPDYDQRFTSAMGWRRVLGVPMLRQDKALGVVVVAWSEPGPIPKVQEELLRTFADQAVIAVENARLFDEIQEKSRQLELANTYKSRFLAAASHDLRQPLHALNLFAAQMRTAVDPSERSRLVVQIDAAIGAMNELFDALLDMSKLDAGVLEASPSEFPAAHLLERMKTTFAEAAHEKGLRLGVVPTRAWIRSDFILLERILLNLVSNAVRYTTKGGVVVGCRRRAGRLRFEVSDSGPGIPEDQKENIFGEFYQIAARATAARGGLGLGLAIVDRLGRLLDHPVEVASRLGRGSRFSVSVPRVAERAVPREPADSLARVADTVSGKLVVVIDDDALVLSAMEGILRSWGCNAVTAPTEGAALAAVRQLDRQPDLIISDYRLAEGRTGIDAIEGLRRALGSAVPAFLMSGDTAPDRLRDATRGNYALLHKPVAPMTLRAMVNRYLRPATSPHPRAGNPMPPPR